MEYKLINQPDKEKSVIEQILSNRGIEDIPHYLHTTDEDIFSPSLLDNIDLWIKKLFQGIKENKHATVVIDCDADGFMSSSLLLNYLYKIVPSYVEHYVDYYTHEGKEHGIHLDEVLPWTELLIVPDAGTNDVEACKVLAERGVEICIADHHLKDVDNPYATIVNNQCCDYPTKSLSGACVVWKICCRIDELLETNYADDLIDLAAFAAIGDVMDLRDYETRRIIEKGIGNIKNPFLQAMVEKQAYSLGGEITPIGIAFYIIPYVNAVVRMGTMEDKMLMFEAMLDWKGNEQIPSTKRGCKGEMESRATQACRNAGNIKNHQQKARDEAMELITQYIDDNGLDSHKVLAVRLTPEMAIPKTLTGLVANMLMAKYGKPVLLLNQTENGWEGSARNVSNSSFEDFRQFSQDSDLVLYAAGHENAYGFGISAENFDKFIDYADKELIDYDFSPCYKVDFIYSSSYFNSSNILDIARLKHLWGTGIDEPYVAIEGIKITDNVILMSPDKNPTMKIQLPNGVSLIKFKSSAEEVEKLTNINGMATKINVIGRCAINEWNGNISAQLMVDDYEICGYEYDF